MIEGGSWAEEAAEERHLAERQVGTGEATLAIKHRLRYRFLRDMVSTL